MNMSLTFDHAPLPYVLAVTFMGLSFIHESAAQEDANPHFFRELSAEQKAILQEREASLDQISVRELNQFHLALLGRAVLQKPTHLIVVADYLGIVRDRGNVPVPLGDSGPEIFSNVRGYGSIGSPLSWQINNRKGGLVIETLWISVRRTTETVAECPLPKRTLFVNIADAAARKQRLEMRRNELGGRSVLEFLRQLEKGPSELEMRKPPERK